jgi:outer membrane protein OmpA-like peptidoglycan-associated protein
MKTLFVILLSIFLSSCFVSKKQFNTTVGSLNIKIDSLQVQNKEAYSKIIQMQNYITALQNPPIELDADSDGVPNSKDLEPETPKGNLVNFQGITIPQVPAITITAPQFSVYFAVNSSVVDENNKEKVAAAAKMLKDNPTLKFDLVGHGDKTGGAVYEEILSKNRAQAVFDLLTKSFGIEASRLTVTGKGYDEPISTDILSVNRRVDFIIVK